MKLVLIGLRGTGKSTVGRILAQRLSRKFFDTDEIVQKRAGKSIRQIFADDGEKHFRELESQVVCECAAAQDAVIATGGGAILNPHNVEALKAGGFAVHLSASPADLWHRITRDKASQETRPPLLKDASSGIDELKKLMLSRAAAYAHARDAEVEVEGRSPDEVADAILILMKAHGVR